MFFFLHLLTRLIWPRELQARANIGQLVQLHKKHALLFMSSVVLASVRKQKYLFSLFLRIIIRSGTIEMKMRAMAEEWKCCSAREV